MSSSIQIYVVVIVSRSLLEVSEILVPTFYFQRTRRYRKDRIKSNNCSPTIRNSSRTDTLQRPVQDTERVRHIHHDHDHICYRVYVSVALLRQRGREDMGALCRVVRCGVLYWLKSARD